MGIGGINPQFLPSLSGIMLLFSRLVTAASLWVHILAINLFAARAAYLQGAQASTSHLCSFHQSLVQEKSIVQETEKHTWSIGRYKW